jgi:hypothetical protein
MNERRELRHGTDLWAIEKDLWLGGVEVYESRVAQEAVLMLPGPKGMLTRSQTIDAIRHSPRWDKVVFQSIQTIHPANNVVLLVYEAIGHRPGESQAYRARCSSLYVDEGERWMLTFHQQTPW